MHHGSGVSGSRQMSSWGGGFIAGQAGIGDVCLGIIDMGIGSQEARAASPCVHATAGSPQELEFREHDF